MLEDTVKMYHIWYWRKSHLIKLYKGILCSMALLLHESERKRLFLTLNKFLKDMDTFIPFSFKYEAIEGKG